MEGIRTWDEAKKIQPVSSTILQKSYQKNRISHAYLFSGERGTKKKQLALFVAQVLFCEYVDEKGNPCGNCSNCRRIYSGNMPNLFIIEPDGLSIKKHQIEFLQEEFTKTGLESRRKVYIINDAHTLTVSASNSLLKFMEEPNGEAFAFLLTDKNNKILPTIISRCQAIKFQPLSQDVMLEILYKEGYATELVKLAVHLTNDMEEVKQWCLSDWFAQARRLMIKLYETIHFQPSHVFIFLSKEFLPHFSKREEQQLALMMLSILYKDLIYVKNGSENDGVFFSSSTMEAQLSKLPSLNKLANALTFILEASKKLQSNVQPQSVFEELSIKIQED